MTVVGPAQDEMQRIALDVTVDGSPLPAARMRQVLEIRVQRGVRAIGQATLTFADPGYDLLSAGTFTIGTRVTVASAVRGAPTLLDGTVTAVASETTLRDGALTTVTVQDRAAVLARGAAVETYTNVTLSDVVKSLAGDHGMRATVPALPGLREYTLRNDTPLGMIDEVAVRSGLDWEVRSDEVVMWEAASGTAPGSSDAVRLRLGEDLLELSVRQVGGGPTTVTVRGKDRSTLRDVTGTATTPASRAGFSVAGTPWQEELVEAQAPVADAAEATGLARARAARTGRVAARGRALFTPRLEPGGTLTVENAGPSSGQYYVRAVTHLFDRGGARTSFDAGDRDPVLLTDPWGTAPTPASFQHTGVFTGTVDKLEDEAHRGMVSVTLPVAGTSPESSAWARVLGAGAGEEHGLHVLPEVGDEVLVVFEHGDVTRPVVLGGLFGANTLPTTHSVANGKVVTRSLTSRTGHRVLLADGDSDSESYIELTLADPGCSLRIAKDGVTLTMPSGKPLKLSAGEAFVQIDGQGKITLKATDIVLDATAKVEVKGTSIAAKASTTLQLEGLTATVKGSSSAALEASGVTTVKGATVAIN